MQGATIGMAATRGSVLVTGASSGIGRACALSLDRAGFRVFAGVRSPDDAATLRRYASANLVPIAIDVTDLDSITRARDEVERAVGDSGLAGLVNNAGIGIAAPLECMPLGDVRAHLEVNAIGPVAVAQAFLPLIRRARGRIVTIGSVGGRITMPFGGALCASKHAVEAFNDALRMELAPFGIRVCLVAPASIRTPAVDKLERRGEEVLARFSPEGRGWYADSFRRFLRVAAARERQGSPPEVVAAVVLRALTDPRPRPRYAVGKDAALMTVLPRLLPERLLDTLRLRLFGLPRAAGGHP
jgi:NAD(P)-dependent dehydrogenase (short-subunit alcohol dehydrogenase family)